MICLEQPAFNYLQLGFLQPSFFTNCLFIFSVNFSRLKRQIARPASGFPTLSVQNAIKNFAPYLKVTNNYIPRLYFASEAEEWCIVLAAQRVMALVIVCRMSHSDRS